MRARPTRTISVAATPISIRKPAVFSFISKIFSAPSAVGVNQVAVLTANDYVAGQAVTLSLKGDGGTLPTGLALNVTYYLIIADSTHLKFATSYVNALAGTAVTIATGTGTASVEIDPVGSDPDALPVTFAEIRYASGGTTVQLVDSPIAVYGDGKDVPADTDYRDYDQSVQRYAIGSGAGPVSIRVTDFES